MYLRCNLLTLDWGIYLLIWTLAFLFLNFLLKFCYIVDDNWIISNCISGYKYLYSLYFFLLLLLWRSSDDGTCRIWDARHSQSTPRIYIPRPHDSAIGQFSSFLFYNLLTSFWFKWLTWIMYWLREEQWPIVK